MTSRARITAAFLIVLALFPCISADDDALRLDALGLASNGVPNLERDYQQSGPSFDLLADRLLEELDHFQVSAVYSLKFTPRIGHRFQPVVLSLARRELPACSGRAPPFA